MDIHRYPGMRQIEIVNNDLLLKENVELVFEKKITPFGNSAKIDVPKKFRGWRAYVIVVKD